MRTKSIEFYNNMLADTQEEVAALVIKDIWHNFVRASKRYKYLDYVYYGMGLFGIEGKVRVKFDDRDSEGYTWADSFLLHDIMTDERYSLSKPISQSLRNVFNLSFFLVNGLNGSTLIRTIDAEGVHFEVASGFSPFGPIEITTLKKSKLYKLLKKSIPVFIDMEKNYEASSS